MPVRQAGCRIFLTAQSPRIQTRRQTPLPMCRPILYLTYRAIPFRVRCLVQFLNLCQVRPRRRLRIHWIRLPTQHRSPRLIQRLTRDPIPDPILVVEMRRQIQGERGTQEAVRVAAEAVKLVAVVAVVTVAAEAGVKEAVGVVKTNPEGQNRNCYPPKSMDMTRKRGSTLITMDEFLVDDSERNDRMI